MTTEERREWLATLTLVQLQALACAWKVRGWRGKMVSELRKILVDIEGIEVPVDA